MSAPTIRAAQLSDAPEMARLAEQLGYPTSTDEMARLLGRLLASAQHFVAVAASGPGRLRGWAHIEHRSSIEGRDRAELMGLVVDTSARGHGTGRALVEAVERWAAERDLGVLIVRSNVARELSHPFYEALGYTRQKTQHVYKKTVSAKDGTTAREPGAAD